MKNCNFSNCLKGLRILTKRIVRGFANVMVSAVAGVWSMLGFVGFFLYPVIFAGNPRNDIPLNIPTVSCLVCFVAGLIFMLYKNWRENICFVLFVVLMGPGLKYVVFAREHLTVSKGVAQFLVPIGLSGLLRIEVLPAQVAIVVGAVSAVLGVLGLLGYLTYKGLRALCETGAQAA